MLKKLKEEDFITTISPISERIEIVRNIFSGAFHKDNISQPITWTRPTAPTSGSLYSVFYDVDKDSPYSTKLLSLAFGYSTASAFYNTSDETSEDKLRVYKLFAKKLLGNKETPFRINNRDVTEAGFITISRNQLKDGLDPFSDMQIDIIPSGSFSGAVPPKSYDYAYANSYSLVPDGKVQDSFGGKFVFLRTKQDTFGAVQIPRRAEGIAFLDAGVFVLDMISLSASQETWDQPWSGSKTYSQMVSATGDDGLIDNIIFGLRHRIGRVRFRNISRMRSSFVRTVAEKEEYNYSTNPSFTKWDGRIITTSGSGERKPTTYITTVGLYNRNEELVATAKLNKPIKKDSDTKVIINVRLEY